VYEYIFAPDNQKKAMKYEFQLSAEILLFLCSGGEKDVLKIKRESLAAFLH